MFIGKTLLSILLINVLIYIVYESLGYKNDKGEHFCSDAIEFSRKLSPECNVLVPDTYQRQLLISGTGRSGTHWMTALLQETGIRVLHVRFFILFILIKKKEKERERKKKNHCNQI